MENKDLAFVFNMQTNTFISFYCYIVKRMRVLSWLKNKIIGKSIDDLVKTGLERYEIEYDPSIGARFYGTKSPELGFAIYHRFVDPKTKELDDELANYVASFVKLYHKYFNNVKDYLPDQKENFLQFAYISFAVWKHIVDDKIDEEPEPNFLDDDDILELIKEKDPDLVEQVKTRIVPDKRLKAIGYQASDLVLLEAKMKKYGYPTYFSAEALTACEKKDIGYLMIACFLNQNK